MAIKCGAICWIETGPCKPVSISPVTWLSFIITCVIVFLSHSADF